VHRSSTLLLVTAALLAATGTLAAQTYTPPAVPEYTLLENLIASNSSARTIAANLAASATIDSYGNVGQNEPTYPTTYYPDFNAAEQRGAILPLVAAVLVGDSTNVAKNFKAITVVYQSHQVAQGNPLAGAFAESTTGGGNFTNSGAMDTFLAESNHAMHVLLQSPYASATDPNSGLTYGAEINALAPQIYYAEQYMYINNYNHGVTGDNALLNDDNGSPNRSMQDTDAYSLTLLLLQDDLGYAIPSGAVPQYSDIETQAQWWLSQIFVDNTLHHNRPLVDIQGGEFFEGGNYAGMTYDTSYQAVALAFADYYIYNIPGDFSTGSSGITASSFLKQAADFLNARIVGASNGTPLLDSTCNTRTGHIAGYQDPTSTTGPGAEDETWISFPTSAGGGKSTDVDPGHLQFDALFYAAAYGDTHYLADFVAGANAYSLTSNVAPVLYSDSSSLTWAAPARQSSTRAFYSTNACTWATTGEDSYMQANNNVCDAGDTANLSCYVWTQPMAPQFAVTVRETNTGNQLALTESAPYSYTYSGGDPIGSGDGIVALTVPYTTVNGTYTYTLTPVNQYGTGASVNLTVLVGPVPTITFTVPNHYYGDAAFSVSASSNSTGAITYSVVSGPATISNSTVSLTGTGTVVLAATQAPSSSYNSTTVNTNFTVLPAVLSVGVTGSPSRLYGQANPAFTPRFSGFVYSDTQSSATTGSPSIMTAAVPKSAVGTFPITVAQGSLAAPNYSLNFTNGSLSVTGSVPQSLSFAPLGNFTHGTSVQLAAEASSGLPVSFAVATGPATVSGNTLSITGTGAVTVTASQSGNANFAAATSVSRSFTAQ
jgi:hypothetical protein